MGNALACCRAPPSYAESCTDKDPQTEKDALRACIEHRKQIVLWASDTETSPHVLLTKVISAGDTIIEAAFAVFLRRFYCTADSLARQDLRDMMLILMGLPPLGRSAEKQPTVTIVRALIRFSQGYSPAVEWPKTGNPCPEKGALAACIERRRAGYMQTMMDMPLDTTSLTIVEIEFLKALKLGTNFPSDDNPAATISRITRPHLMGLSAVDYQTTALVRFAQGYTPAVEWPESSKPRLEKGALAACIERRRAGYIQTVLDMPLDTASLTIVEIEFFKALKQELAFPSITDSTTKASRISKMYLMDLSVKDWDATALVRFAQGYEPTP